MQNEVLEGEVLETERAATEHVGPPYRVIFLPAAAERALRSVRYPRAGPTGTVKLVDLLLVGDRYVSRVPVVFGTLAMLEPASFHEFAYYEIKGIAPPETLA